MMIQKKEERERLFIALSMATRLSFKTPRTMGRVKMDRRRRRWWTTLLSKPVK